MASLALIFSLETLIPVPVDATMSAIENLLAAYGFDEDGFSFWLLVHQILSNPLIPKLIAFWCEDLTKVATESPSALVTPKARRPVRPWERYIIHHFSDCFPILPPSQLLLSPTPWFLSSGYHWTSEDHASEGSAPRSSPLASKACRTTW